MAAGRPLALWPVLQPADSEKRRPAEAAPRPQRRRPPLRTRRLAAIYRQATVCPAINRAGAARRGGRCSGAARGGLPARLPSGPRRRPGLRASVAAGAPR